MIFLTENGYIQVSAYTGVARLPLEDVAFTVTASDGTALAMRLTDRNGRAAQIPIPVPDARAGQSPDTGVVPYTAVNIYARLEGFEQLENENLQVFADTVTQWNAELIPLPEFPAAWDKAVVYDTPPQDL